MEADRGVYSELGWTYGTVSGLPCCICHGTETVFCIANHVGIPTADVLAGVHILNE